MARSGAQAEDIRHDAFLRHRRFGSPAGLLYVAAGIVAILHPLLAAVAITLMLGAGLIAAGLARLVAVRNAPAGAPRGWLMFAAVATALPGMFVLAMWPVNSLFLLGALLAVDLVLQGAGWTRFGLALRRRRG